MKESLRYRGGGKREEGSTGGKSENVGKESRFLKQELREERGGGLVESPSVMDILKQGDISSVEGMNSSQ